MTSRAVPHHRVIVVGTGFGGIGAAIRLAQSGVDDVVLLERGDDLGGTWRDNTYPGCACDVQSHVYSFSFAPNPDWSHTFPRQPDVLEYLRRCARDFGVVPHIRFGTEVTGARWDESTRRWHVSTSRGAFSADVLVLATGPLSEPVTPALPGLERFRGAAFHSARWDHTVDVTGKRVAVIGTGASGAQLVPEIQPAVATLDVYQRTPPWVMPRLDRPLGARARRLFRRVPAAQRALRGAISVVRELMVTTFRRPRLMRHVERVARWHLAKAVADPTLRARLTPDYRMGCKRVIVSDDYLPALARPNVAVVTAPIAEVRDASIVDADGVERATDVIVFATGFRPTDPPIAPHVRGRDGRTLADVWQGSPRAYAGTTVAGFPNLFVLLGPNTGLGHNSVVLMIEAQVEHLLGALRHLGATGAAALEPRAEAQAAWVAEVERRTAGTVWTDGGCRSWYLDRTGRSSAIWPDTSWRFRRASRFRAEDYQVFPRS